MMQKGHMAVQYMVILGIVIFMSQWLNQAKKLLLSKALLLELYGIGFSGFVVDLNRDLRTRGICRCHREAGWSLGNLCWRRPILLGSILQ
jgi:hypothetical protein